MIDILKSVIPNVYISRRGFKLEQVEINLDDLKTWLNIINNGKIHELVNINGVDYRVDEIDRCIGQADIVILRNAKPDDFYTRN